jgi:hypothetical protein
MIERLASNRLQFGLAHELAGTETRSFALALSATSDADKLLPSRWGR